MDRELPIVLNSRNINELSPYVVLSPRTVTLPFHLLSSVGYFLRQVGLSYSPDPQTGLVHIRCDDLVIDTPADEDMIRAGKKRSIAQPILTQAEELVKQLKFAALWRYNYEYWYEYLGGLKLLDSKQQPYSPVVQGVTFITLSPQEVALFRYLLKKKLWWVAPWTPEEQTEFDALKKKIAKYVPPNLADGYFCRMSGHSPKDAKASLRVTTVDEMLSLLTKSERILTDFEIARKFILPTKPFQIILAPWDPTMSSVFEFRCFVHKKKLTAISQYEYNSSFDELQDINLLARIRASIILCHNQTAAFIPYPSYVFDVFISDHTDSCRSIILECNPFGGHLSSGSCLFDWKADGGLLCSEEENVVVLLRARKKSEQVEFIDVVVN